MILLIDGNNLAVVMNSIGSMSRKDGFPTQGIAGFLNTLRGYATQFDPKKIFVFWDGGKSKRRLELLPTYKQNRQYEKKTEAQKMSYQELLVQLPIIKQAVCDLGLFSISGKGVEADDLIATMARAAEQKKEKAIICSSDSDFHQLVSEYVSIYSTTTRSLRHINLSNFSEAHAGLTPEQYLELKSLQGDTSDDIPGVKGIGEKTALKLLLEYGSVDGFRKAVEAKTIEPTKTLQKIIDNWSDFELSKKMIDLRDPLVTFTGVSIHKQDPDFSAVKAMALENGIAKIFTDFRMWVQPFKQIFNKEAYGTIA